MHKQLGKVCLMICTDALRAFAEVLKINPHADGARARVETLRDKLRAQGA
ncbi:MAG: hypothetical protein QNJ58_22685 [Desulfobacterales bacterium]|nr:hypothetical protein [Desulfobacterales bacterium]